MTQPIHINVRFQAKPGKQDELARRMVELGPDVESLGGTSVVTVDSDDEAILYFIETFPDQAAMDADMQTPLVQALVADLDELTVHGTDFRIERSSPVAR
jgi:quinol monooxygenase YgiN